MKTLIITIVTICLLAAVICLALQTEVPTNFWLWVAGLAGPAIAVMQLILQSARKLFEQGDHPDRNIQRDKKIRTL